MTPPRSPRSGYVGGPARSPPLRGPSCLRCCSSRACPPAPADPAAPAGGGPLDALLADLRRFEERRPAGATDWSSDYRCLVPPGFDEIILTRTETGRDVRRADGSARVEHETRGVDAAGKVSAHRSVWCYDGDRTLIRQVFREPTGVANISPGLRPSPKRWNPYFLFYRSKGLRAGFARWLRQDLEPGDRPLKKNGLSLRLEDEGAAEVDGLTCRRLRAVFVRGTGEEARDRSSWLFFLAEDRCLLPVRAEYWNTDRSPDKPIEVVTLDELEEVEPGLWRPRVATHEAADTMALVTGGPHRPGWRKTYRVAHGGDPGDPADLCAGAAPEPGDSVYVVEDGEIAESYVEGDSGT